MAYTSVVNLQVLVSGDETWQLDFSTESNANSPAQNEIKTLALGANTITPPSGGTSPNGVLIIPPADNETAILLKRVTGDTGISLHLTNPTYMALGSSTDTFVLTAAAQIAGVRFIWS